MARSLGLTAYRALARKGEAQNAAPDTARPTGELAWIHAAEPSNLIAILDLAGRLRALRTGLSVLITVTEGVTDLPQQLDRGQADNVILRSTPNEHPQSVAAFLDHWKPDVCVWAWGGLLPNLVLATAARGCPMLLIDADAKGFDGRRDRWLTDLTRDLLTQFSGVLARSDAAQRRLTNLGLSRADVNVTSPLLAGGQALACVDSDLADISSALGGRPVWFAAQVLAKELATVLSAQSRAMRLSHRLLLILQPANAADAALAVELAADRGFTVIRWGDGSYPDDTTQVMVVEDAAERGLFFRVAPVSFLGSSLTDDRGGCDPFEAAALGSAVLYGPKVRNFMPSYTRLAAAGAARIVNDADALGTAVSRLIAPDQAAAMAHAGWDVISEGAAAMDRVIDMVQDALDTRAGSD